MKAVDLPLVIEGHEPISTPKGAACEGRVLSGMGELAGAGMAMSARGHGEGQKRSSGRRSGFWAQCAGSVIQGGLEGAAQVAVS